MSSISKRTKVEQNGEKKAKWTGDNYYFVHVVFPRLIDQSRNTF